jgi:hypothetical protein
VIETFVELPTGNIVALRPTVTVVVAGMYDLPFVCLADSGSLHNRMPSYVAAEAGIELAGVPEQIALGGVRLDCWTVDAIPLEAGDATWTAPVSFCQPCSDDFPFILGQEGFFRHFVVTIRAADYLIEYVAEDR